jgi:methanogenic corrinoid protein MtbC1
MSHHHHHDHKDEHHDHKHDHHDHHHSESLSFEEKMSKLLEHWLKHNSDHVQTYQEWGQKAKDAGLNDMAVILQDIAAASSALNQKFEAASSLLKK